MLVKPIPGVVPKLLSDPSVGLFRADERVFEAVVESWCPLMLARRLTSAHIENRLSAERRFQQFTGTFPGRWNPADIEDYLAERRYRESPHRLRGRRLQADPDLYLPIGSRPDRPAAK